MVTLAPRSTPYLLLAAALLLVGVGLVTAHLVLARQHHQEERSRAVREATLAADAFEQHTLQLVRQADVLLRAVRHDYLKGRSSAQSAEFIERLGFDTAIIENVFIVGTEGGFIVPDGTEAARNVLDRDYFQFHRQHPGDDLFVSAVELGRLTGKYRFRLSRRFEGPDGGFGGVVLATVTPQSFTRYLHELKLGPQSVASLLGTHDRRLRARLPAAPDDAWNTPIDLPLWAALDRSPVGSIEDRSPVDGITRVFHYKQVAGLPLVVAVGFSEADVLGRIAERKRWLLATEALLGVVALLFGLVIVRTLRSNDRLTAEVQRRERTEAALLVRELEYRRIVETATEGIISLDRDFRLTFVNARFAQMLGYQVPELLRRPVVELCPEDQVADNEAQLAQRRRGLDSVYERCFLTKEGGRRWVLVSAKAILDAQGRCLGSFAMVTDIHARKEAETERERLIDELRVTLARVQQLEGILPICSFCKRIRDDTGDWQQVERYITRHSETRFTHGVCPDCLRKNYPEVADEVQESLDKDE